MSALLTDVKTISGNKLHKLVKESKTVDAVFTALASRARIRGFTDIKRLQADLVRNKFDINEKEMEELFKELQKEGYGYIVRPRELNGNPRFMWKYDMRKVATAAIHGQDVLSDELPKKHQRQSDASRKPKVKVIRKRIPKRELIVNTEETEIFNKPVKFNLNGQEYIAMPQTQYEVLKRLENIIDTFKK